MAGAIAGGLLVFLLSRVHMARLEERLSASNRESGVGKTLLEQTQAELRSKAEALASTAAALESERSALTNTIKALSAEALHDNRESFLTLANETLGKFQENAKGQLEQRTQAFDALLRPVSETLSKLDSNVRELEKSREGAYGELRQYLGVLSDAQLLLQKETRNLVAALRSPTVRGQWGEIQLKRVAELAGIEALCEFQEQFSSDDLERKARPDLVVRLTPQKVVYVDAKTPLGAYLDAAESSDDTTRKEKFAQHARQIRAHATSLSRKTYWKFSDESPEFVILFLPGEQFLGAALDADPALSDDAAKQKVIITTPTTLIGLLRAIYHVSQHEQAAKRAHEITELGNSLYKRLATLGEHFLKVGSSLQRSVEHYNDAVGSLERNVMSSARKFKDLGSASREVEISPMEPVDLAVRTANVPEFTPLLEPILPYQEEPLELAERAVGELPNELR
ncbi:MAG: DNA recombination protein RmuC [Candidatus Eremiobacteraeota bacterium]|nr:DNA recombination protein RmuC [Candidatus Eremiobacteraeota bacterium]